MTKYRLSIVRDQQAWKVGDADSWDGPYRSLGEAMDIALHTASVLHAAGHGSTIHVPYHHGDLEIRLKPRDCDAASCRVAPAVSDLSQARRA